MPSADVDVRALVARIDSLLADVESIENETARETSLAAVTALVDLYGEALARILAHVTKHAEPSAGLLRVLLRDELVRHLLLLHDLHPDGTLDDRSETVSNAERNGHAPALVTLARAPARNAHVTRAPAVVKHEAADRCEMCAGEIADDHRHLVDIEERRLKCVCRPCSLLFSEQALVNRRYRLVGDTVRGELTDFELDDAVWDALGIPVGLTFFYFDSGAGRVVAMYPSALGATMSQLPLDAWNGLTDRNPVLRSLTPDTEALLANRTRGKRDYWLVPIDRCYALVGLIRAQWKGIAGGDDVWHEIDGFLETLRHEAAAH
ncbi:MAG TPA: DUF5947 family protein [Gemmatimonadaceae bacterium]|nr:DUF5947 family protein [Gemmatimonadaceae bacterium]